MWKMEKTPLYEAHIKAGGKMVDFHGWLLPVQYGSIIGEHKSVRSRAGLFDVSHMGEIWVSGTDAEEYLQGMLTNDISKISDFQEIYSPMCYSNGGTVDDLIVYRMDQKNFLIIVNASNAQKDFEWLLENRKGEVSVENLSNQYAQLALQGPMAQEILQKLTAQDLNEIKFFHFKCGVDLAGIEALVSRSGYTGEDGFEIYLKPDDAARLWDKLLNTGSSYGLEPAGLGARDTLRFESAMPLYGQELSEKITPLEAGLGRYVKLDKKTFTGRDVLVAQLERGLQRKLVGFELLDRGIPRNGCQVLVGGKKAGYVTSGGFAPSLKKNLGMALVETAEIERLSDVCAAAGGGLQVVIRDKALNAGIVKLPFYNKKYKK